MGFWRDFLKVVFAEVPQRTDSRQATIRLYNPQEYRIFKQEQSGECWHGVALSELSKLAKNTYRGRYVTVDQYNFLVFHYTSNSGKSKYMAQCFVDENGKLAHCPQWYHSGQYRDSSDEFVEKANRQFVFCRENDAT